MNQWKLIIEMLQSHARFVLTTHTGPDPDAIGSLIALTLALQEMGRTARIVNCDPLPVRYRFIDPDELFLGYQQTSPPHPDEVVIVLDVCALNRLGEMGQFLKSNRRTTICIDHHVVQTPFWDAGMIDSDAPAAGVLVFRLLQRMGHPLSVRVAQAIYLAVMGDTGGFRYANTTPEALQIAAQCALAGAHPNRLAVAIYETNPPQRIELFRRALDQMQLVHDGKIAWTAVPQKWLQETGSDASDLEGLVEYLRGIEGVEVACVIREIDAENAKASFRSAGDSPFDVSQLAQSFGGGGHRVAAGATIHQPLKQSIATVLACLEEKFGAC